MSDACSPRCAKRALADTTKAKHLRVLHGCFQAAVESAYTGQNPIKRLGRAERPRPGRRESPHFQRAEIAALFGVFEPGVFRNLAMTALKTGARLGELRAARWGDLNLGDQTFRVRHSITAGIVSDPKNRRARTIDLTTDVCDVLGAWWGELGRPGDGTLVFPGPTATGYLDVHNCNDRLYDAMRTAGVPREDATGQMRTFHSLRHTFASVALQQGRPITWVQRQLGHSSITVTVDRYGHFEREASRREAALLEGAFGV